MTRIMGKRKKVSKIRWPKLQSSRGGTCRILGNVSLRIHVVLDLFEHTIGISFQNIFTTVARSVVIAEISQRQRVCLDRKRRHDFAQSLKNKTRTRAVTFPITAVALHVLGKCLQKSR